MTRQQTESNNTYTWRAHPARERRGRLLVGMVWIAAFVLVVYATTNSPTWAAFSLLVLVFALNRFFFPSRFTIDDAGITAEYPIRTKRLEWERLQRFAHDDDGAFLSPHPNPSRLDSWRGLHILFGENREEIVERIQQHLPQRKEAA